MENPERESALESTLKNIADEEKAFNHKIFNIGKWIVIVSLIIAVIFCIFVFNVTMAYRPDMGQIFLISIAVDPFGAVGRFFGGLLAFDFVSIVSLFIVKFVHE